MSKQSAPPICRQPDHIISYFSMQKGILAVITVSGLIYNLGLMVRPWFPSLGFSTITFGSNKIPLLL